MKKTFAVILTAICIFALFSCARSIDPPQGVTSASDSITEPGTEQEATITTVPDPGTEIGPDTAILGGVGAIRENRVFSIDETVALDVSLSLPYAEIADNDDVQARVTQKIDEITAEILEYVENKGEIYRSQIESGNIPLETPNLSVSFTLCCFTEKAMSFMFNFTETNGYGNTAQSCRYYNFELDAYGAPITFDTLFSDRMNDNRSEMIEKVKEKAAARGDLYMGHDAIIEELAPTNWYISGSKIIFRFDPYLVAPSSSGFISFEFSLSELRPLISEYGSELLGID